MNSTGNVNRDPQASAREWIAAEKEAFLAAYDATDLVATDMQTRHGSIEAARSFVAAKAISYHRTHPGRASLSPTRPWKAISHIFSIARKE
jgi:hypothetical protein